MEKSSARELERIVFIKRPPASRPTSRSLLAYCRVTRPRPNTTQIEIKIRKIKKLGKEKGGKVTSSLLFYALFALIDRSIDLERETKRGSMDLLESIECVSSSDGLEEEDTLAHLPRHPYPKSGGGGAGNGGGVGAGNGTGAVAIAGGPMMPPATSVHELLECPVCTNSMYPPIHQVCNLNSTLIR